MGIFFILATLTLGTAIAAMTLRNLVHCALAVALTFAGLAAIYLQLNAQFVGFAQFLIYVGAVAILIVFAILLTRGSEPPQQALFSSSWPAGVALAVAVFALLGGLVLSSKVIQPQLQAASNPTVAQLGSKLMTKYVLPLQVLGLLLTAALIGAVIIAMKETESEK
jgi:NADH-quinone oxidoreductase subunit J